MTEENVYSGLLANYVAWYIMPEVSINYDLCIDCKTCTSICPMGVYKDEGDKVSVAAQEECIACMGCVGACPVDAITVVE